MKAIRLALLPCLILTCATGFSQTGSLVSDQVHAVSLERNLLGDSPDRSVNVYLPPGYEKQTKVRYPVVYLLHGFNYEIPSYVFFSHRAHLTAGSACADCHGEVKELEQMYRAKEINMASCMNCHQAKGASIDCTYCHEKMN